jgi:tRNA (guanine37-N1)-methyltransferase
MRIDIFTIFPEYLDAPLRVSLVGKARDAGLLDVRLHDPRDATTDRHRSVDDEPFGGGAGMVMKPEPLFAIVEQVQPARPLLLLSASGRRFDDATARELAAGDGFSLICGRYEGVDQRVADHLCDGELSVGDFVLAGGEAAALVVVEAVARLRAGVLGNEASAVEESFGDGLLEYPQYTRPAEFRGWEVPEVLRSGDHPRIARWRRAQAVRRTRARRPDLLARPLSADEQAALDDFSDPPASR